MGSESRRQLLKTEQPIQQFCTMLQEHVYEKTSFETVFAEKLHRTFSMLLELEWAAAASEGVRQQQKVCGTNALYADGDCIPLALVHLGKSEEEVAKWASENPSEGRNKGANRVRSYQSVSDGLKILLAPHRFLPAASAG